jgi:outer membrane lipoprotein-sorting protein
MNVDQNEDRKLDELLRLSYAELSQTNADQRRAVLMGLSDARRNANPPVRHASRAWQRWALAAAGLIALFAAWSWRTTGPGNVAYGIDDVPQRLAQVQSISIRGWQWVRDTSGANKPPTRVPIEFLIQRPGRFRYTVTGISSQGGHTEILQGVDLCDGAHEWFLGAGNKPRFSRPVGALDALLKTEMIGQIAAELAVLGPPDASYRKIGKDNANGRQCDLYEARFQLGSSTIVARVWIDPSDGLPVRVVRDELEADGKVAHETELTDIAVNVPLADELFRFNGPEDTKQSRPNAAQPPNEPLLLDTSPTGSGSSGDAKLEAWQALRIADNAALVVWRRSGPVAQADAVPDWLSGVTMNVRDPHGDRALRHQWMYQSNSADRWNWSLVVPADGKPLGRGEINFTIRSPRRRTTVGLTALRFKEDDLRQLLRAAQRSMLPNSATDVSLPYLRAVARKLSSAKSSD